MNIFTYIVGSFYIMSSIFRFSDKVTEYIFNKNILNLPISKYEKINESIYSSIHASIVSFTSVFSITNSFFHYDSNIIENDNSFQYITASISMSYFVVDLLRCLYYKKYLFVIHHLASIYLLLFTFHAFLLKENKGFYAMYLIFLLESNTFLLNIGFLLKELKFHYSITCFTWIIHLIFFILFRIITIPKILFIYYYNEGLTYHSLMQLPAFILIMAGSIYWSYRQAFGIKKYLKENSVI
jgi:hypothetical protein